MRESPAIDPAADWGGIETGLFMAWVVFARRKPPAPGPMMRRLLGLDKAPCLKLSSPLPERHGESL